MVCSDDDALSRLEDDPAAVDVSDPYADIDLDELPVWWQDAVRKHWRCGLRPYRPPRFDDGVLKYEVVERLEAQLDITIRFIGFNVDEDSHWEIRVDGETVGKVDHHRDPAGYSVFEIASTAFEDHIREILE